jgi:hypothetical protein
MIVPYVILFGHLRVFVARAFYVVHRTASNRCFHASVTNSDNERLGSSTH